MRSNSRNVLSGINKVFCSMLIVFAMMLSMVFSMSSVYAAVSEEQAMATLQTKVFGAISENTYKLKEGGSVKGSDLFEESDIAQGAKGYDLKEDVFNRLSSDAQTQLVEDIATQSDKVVTEEADVDESTVALWWQELQTKKGVGSKFMMEILKHTKPNFVAANNIYQPFAGPIGVLMGLIAVVMMGVLGVVIVSDIAYITLPPVRILVNEKREGKGAGKSLIFSHAATHAVELAEDGGGQGESKQALGIYFKNRLVMLILLGICLLYLVNGSLYTLVGYILDIVSGFLGF